MSQYGLTYQRSLSMFQTFILHPPGRFGIELLVGYVRYQNVISWKHKQRWVFSGQVIEPGLQLDIEDSQTSIKDFALFRLFSFRIPLPPVHLHIFLACFQEDYDRILEAVSGGALDCRGSKLTGSCYYILLCLKWRCLDFFCMFFIPTKKPR